MTLAYNERETLETLYPLWSKVTKVKKRIRKCKINIKKKRGNQERTIQGKRQQKTQKETNNTEYKKDGQHGPA